MVSGSHEWMRDYELTTRQKATLRDSAIKAERMFQVFNWRWASIGIPTAFQIEEQYKAMVKEILKHQGKNGEADYVSTGRLFVNLIYVDDESLDAGFFYGVILGNNIEDSDDDKIIVPGIRS